MLHLVGFDDNDDDDDRNEVDKSDDFSDIASLPSQNWLGWAQSDVFLFPMEPK